MARPPAIEKETAVRLVLNVRSVGLTDDHYRPGQAPQRVEKPGILSGDSVLPGFQFDFREIL